MHRCISIHALCEEGDPPKLKLESKDIMKRRGLPSPDRADAVALSLYQPVTYTWEIG